MLGLGGGPPGDDHHIFPVLKLGDLGHAMQMTQNAMDDSYVKPLSPTVGFHMLTRPHSAG